MINKLSSYLTEKLLSNGTINENDKELYIYGLFMLFSHILFFFVAYAFGLILGCALESIIFYIAFQFIRRYAGGYHASTETRCEILSALSLLGCIGIIKLSEIYNFQIALLCITLCSVVCIFMLCPLDTPEKPLSEKEFKYFRKVSWMILLVITVAVVVSYIFKFRIVTVPCCLSLILESVLLIAGKVKRSSQKQNVET